MRALVTAYACCPPDAPQFSGGEDQLGWNLVSELAKRCDLHVLTHAVDQPVLDEAWAARGTGRVTFVYVALPRWLQPLRRLPGGLQAYCYLWQFAAWRRARRLARRVRFDVTHHLTYANDWMANFTGAWLPVPYVRGPGGGAHRVPSGMLTLYSWPGRFSEWLRSAAQFLFRADPAFRAGQERAHRLLVCNREALEALPPRWRAKAHVFPVNGVSEADFEALAGRGPRAAGPLRVLSVGKLVRLKGFPLVLEAFRRFHERHPDARLEIIGDGPDRPVLERFIARWGLRDHVALTPWQPRERVLERLTQCDVFLFASMRDGGGAVVVEALAAGKPVICLDLAGPGHHVTAECGIKVPACAPHEAARGLADALARLAGDEGLRQAMGQAARTRARQYHWTRLGEDLFDVYRHAVGGWTEPSATVGRPHGLATAAAS